MTDTVRVIQEQIDDTSGEPISRVTCEWFGSDRDTANEMSISLVEGMAAKVREWAASKAGN